MKQSTLIGLLFSLIYTLQLVSHAQQTQLDKKHTHVENESPVEVTGNAIFLYQNSNFQAEDQNSIQPNEKPNGLNIRELEIELTAPVESQVHLFLQLSAEPEFKTNENGEIEEEWSFGPEEAYVTIDKIPDLSIKLGQFKASIGKHNLLHPDDFPLIYAPLANMALLGDDGFVDVGLSATWTLPTLWKSQIIGQYFRGAGENEQFNSPTPGDGAYLLKLINQFKITDSTNFELGLSSASGKNLYDKSTNLSAVDLALLWSPDADYKYSLIEFNIEFLQRDIQHPTLENEKSSGQAYWLQYNFSEKWSTLYRFDTLNFKNSFDELKHPNKQISRNSLAVVYFSSEHSNYKIEYSQAQSPNKNSKGESEKALYLQANFTIGAHKHH